MQIENLEDWQVEKLQSLCDGFGGPVKHKTFNMEDMDFSKRLTVIEDKIAAIDTKLDRIFGAHNLIDGQWVDIEKRHRKGLKKGGFNHNR